MQHILNIAFDFDDERVRKTAEYAVANEMTNIVKEIVTDKIAPMTTSSWNRNSKERDWSNLWERVDSAIEKIVADNRDEIIERAAAKLVRSAKSTKAWKEKFLEIVEEER